eukprot:1890849-Rhodomonas_salina.4
MPASPEHLQHSASRWPGGGENDVRLKTFHRQSCGDLLNATCSPQRAARSRRCLRTPPSAPGNHGVHVSAGDGQMRAKRSAGGEITSSNCRSIRPPPMLTFQQKQPTSAPAR